MEVRASNGSGGEASASGGISQHAVTGGVTQVASPASSASAVPLCGVSIADFENLHSSAKNGVRVVTWDGVGWSTIEAFWGPKCLPCHASVDVPVTTVLDVGATIDPATTRVIKAAVWDNVKILFGPEAGRIGKVTAFIAGPNGDGIDDTYVIESLTEGKLDARLMDVPTMGWQESGVAVGDRVRATKEFHHMKNKTKPSIKAGEIGVVSQINREKGQVYVKWGPDSTGHWVYDVQAEIEICRSTADGEEWVAPKLP